MHVKQNRLDSLRRVAQRLRQIEGDVFAANMAERLESEIARAAADGSLPTAAQPAAQWDWTRSDYVPR